MPGLTKYGNVTLKWGMTENLSFYEWVAGISNGTKAAAEDRVQDITIYLQDDAHNDIAAGPWSMPGPASTLPPTSTLLPARSLSRAWNSPLRKCAGISNLFA